MPSTKSALPRNRQQKLRAWLEDAILEGQFRPGDRLDEQELCDRFNVSRTPLREALLQLASIDLVVFRPRQGATVARMSVKQIAAMWEVLTELEGLCAALAARRMTDGEREQLRQIHAQAELVVSSDDVVAYDEANRTFHEAIYAGARNDYLANQVIGIRRRLRIYRRYPFQRAGGIERSFQGHQRVVDAISAGADATAAAVMRDHVAGGLSFLDLVAELPGSYEDDNDSGGRAVAPPNPSR